MYFHIKISSKQIYLFRPIPCSLANAPLEFTNVVKEVKLMGYKGVETHQYLDDWLLSVFIRKLADSIPKPSCLNDKTWVGW